MEPCSHGLRNVTYSHVSMPQTKKNNQGPDTEAPFSGNVSFFKKLLLIALVVAIAWFVFKARYALLLAFTATVLAIVLSGVACRLSRRTPWSEKGWVYRLVLTFIVVAVIGLTVGLGFLVGPEVAKDFKELQGDLPEALEKIREYPVVGNFFTNGGEDGSKTTLPPLFSDVFSKAIDMASIAVTAVTWFALVVFMALFAAAEPTRYKQGIISIFPTKHRETAGNTIDACCDAIWDWIVGQGFAMLIIGALTTGGLFLIGMEYALTLGLIAGLLQFVPYLGPILSSIPAILVAVTISPTMVLWVAVLYTSIQFLESNLITPLIFEKKTLLPPVVTLLATVMFTLTFGVLGTVIATPATVLLLTLYNEIYQRKILHAQGS